MEPVVSLCCALVEPKKRSESVQLAAPKPINEMATTRGQKADRRNAHMITRPHANTTKRGS
jgi:hypothetical protein